MVTIVTTYNKDNTVNMLLTMTESTIIIIMSLSELVRHVPLFLFLIFA